MSLQLWTRMPGVAAAIALVLGAGCGDSADQAVNTGGSAGHGIIGGAGGSAGKPGAGASAGTGGTSPQGGSGGIGEAGASGSGESTKGQCGWSTDNEWYECGSQGSDPGGTASIQCPLGLSPSADCGALTQLGCCDQDGNNWYCNDSGVVELQTCSGGGGAGGGGGSSGDGGSNAGGSAGTGGGTSSDVEQLCVDIINQHRASIGRPALTRWTSAESCSDTEAASDSKTHIPHGAFGKCDEWAQNECPGWDGPVETMIADCLQMMWDEGPGGGHYENMSSTDYTQVACGFSQGAQGGIWSVQNFK